MPCEDDFEWMCNRIAKHFCRAEARNHVRSYLAALIRTSGRRNGWQLAKAVGHPTPYAIQHILGRSSWNADDVRNDLISFVCDHLAGQDYVVRFGEIGFSKKGTQSVGVKRQFNWTTHRIENCQVGFFLGCSTSHCQFFFDRELYLPEDWTSDHERRRKATIPQTLEYACKPELARNMLTRTLDAGLRPAWVICELPQDSDAKLCLLLEQRRQPYILALDALGRSQFERGCGPLDQYAANLPPSAWTTFNSESPLNGEFDWSKIVAGRDRDVFQRAVVMRRDHYSPERIKYYRAFEPEGTGLREAAMLMGDRTLLERELACVRSDVGLDQYEVRSWHGWYRHVTLVLWAHAFLVAHRSKPDVESSGLAHSL